MDELPRRHDITIRVAKEEGHHPDPAAFAVAASRAAAGRNASIVSAHTAEEIICVVSVPAAGRPDAVAIALAVVADALKGAEPAPAPGQLGTVPVIVRGLAERRLPELVEATRLSTIR
jgi:hypothetical protein